MPITIRSTRGTVAESLFEALFRGAAPDGGLYLVEGLGSLRDLVIRERTEVPPFARFAGEALSAMLPDLSPSEGWEQVATRAFPFAPRLQPAGAHLILELFHGPTCAFKDFGARFLASMLEAELARRGGRLTILTATSGDTGGAVGSAFAGLDNIDVVILYPSGRISRLQEKQLTTIGGNVSAVEIDGAFDDCQRMVKELFSDSAVSAELHLTSANSINLGRLLPQSLYYLWAAAVLYSARDGSADDVPAPYFTVPSGNFGNLTSGVIAFQSGMPAAGFLAATNLNDIVPHYLSSGSYEPKPSVATISNAMDVGSPSNFERLQTLFSGDHRRMATLIRGASVNEETTRATMRRYYEEFGVIVCPHTAVGLAAADRLGVAEVPERVRSVVLGTAHPGKFCEVVSGATGVQPEIPDRLQRALDLPGESVKMAPEAGRLIEWLRRR